MQSSHRFTVDSAVFDERNLMSAAGLVPVLELAEQTGLSELIDEHVHLPSTRVRSGAVNPAGKLTSIIAGMMCGADSIDDANVLRAGGTPRVFDEVYAPSTLGIFLREFTFGHANQLAAVARAHLVALAARVPLLAGIEHYSVWYGCSSSSFRMTRRFWSREAARVLRSTSDEWGWNGSTAGFQGTGDEGGVPRSVRGVEGRRSSARRSLGGSRGG